MSRLLTIDTIQESIVNFTKTVEELDYDIFYVYTNSCCIHIFSLIKELNFKVCLLNLILIFYNFFSILILSIV